MRCAAGLLLWTCAAAGQVAVYSEFRRVGPDGRLLPQDSQGRPREILSPAIARNGYATFLIVVTATPGRRYYLYIGENPEGALKYNLYRALFEQHGDAAKAASWIPDKLEKIASPATNIVGEATTHIPGHTTDVYVLDLFAPHDAPVRRARIEAQFTPGEDYWIISPLEIRVHGARVPVNVQIEGKLGPVLAPTPSSVLGPLRWWLCGARGRSGGDDLTLRRLIRRNAAQDAAMARELEAKFGAEEVRGGVMKALGRASAEAACKLGPATVESQLRVRDFLYKLALEAPPRRESGASR